jgi:hypoxanthine phosphoribosyltransferase
MEDKLDVSFKEISDAIKGYSLPQVDLIIGIGRGGIVPASLIAHQLSVDLVFAEINYRNDENEPRFEEPRFLQKLDLGEFKGRILIVDDVSVSGKTLKLLQDALKEWETITLVLKGKAEHVLFPHFNSCVNWPWKIGN